MCCLLVLLFLWSSWAECFAALLEHVSVKSDCTEGIESEDAIEEVGDRSLAHRDELTETLGVLVYDAEFSDRWGDCADTTKGCKENEELTTDAKWVKHDEHRIPQPLKETWDLAAKHLHHVITITNHLCHGPSECQHRHSDTRAAWQEECASV